MSRERVLTIALAVVAVSVFLTPFQRELYVGDETKYSQVVREMRDGAFFLPTLHGEPFTHKPPLHFWAMDLLTYPLGVYSLWPYVLPSLLSFLFLLWLMWRIDGPLAAFIAGTSLMVWGSAQTARMDVAFTAFLALAAWQLKKFLDGAQSVSLIYAAIATGIATLIKGPMAPVIMLALLLFERLRRKRLPAGPYWIALFLMALIPLLWFVPAMMLGGDTYTRDVLVKQTAGRAVGAWVHKAAPWFYLTHAPGDLFPWFFLLVVALIAVYKRRDEDTKYYVSWILAVLVPYSVLSSKLDVYMMTLIPPAAIVIARLVGAERDVWTKWGWRVNLFVLGFLCGLGAAAFFLLPRIVKGDDAALAARLDVRLLFAMLAVAALAGLIASIASRRLITSTIALGLVPVAAFVYIAIVLMPLANEMASTRPLVDAILRQGVPPEQVALHVAPHLWVRGMPEEIERVRRVEAIPPDASVVISRRRNTKEIEPSLVGFKKVDEFRLIGKWFDVYRR
ncbi:MAG TPA: glycosyltransferase family 39 protein [Thermoanaerobaculia bacterium]|nr:glycosyltransferase family 39 protein [Thermoanaerobaculia bacterium]